MKQNSKFKNQFNMNVSSVSDRYEMGSLYISQAKPVDLKMWNKKDPKDFRNHAGTILKNNDDKINRPKLQTIDV